MVLAVADELALVLVVSDSVVDKSKASATATLVVAVDSSAWLTVLLVSLFALELAVLLADEAVEPAALLVMLSELELVVLLELATELALLDPVSTLDFEASVALELASELAALLVSVSTLELVVLFAVDVSVAVLDAVSASAALLLLLLLEFEVLDDEAAAAATLAALAASSAAVLVESDDAELTVELETSAESVWFVVESAFATTCIPPVNTKVATVAKTQALPFLNILYRSLGSPLKDRFLRNFMLIPSSWKLCDTP